ncbi:MAG: cyclic-di-AMP receptor [Clostridia bacterium]
MKMVFAIVNQDDTNKVVNELMKKRYQVTKLSTTGGFLKAGNTTILIGVSEEKVDNVIEIIGKFSKTRKQVIPSTSELNAGFFPSVPVEVSVGGATIFVMDVDRFEKV